TPSTGWPSDFGFRRRPHFLSSRIRLSRPILHRSTLGCRPSSASNLTPDTGRVGILINMRNPASVSQQRDAEAAAPTLGIDIVPVDVRSSADIEAAFQALTRERCNFVVVLSDLIFSTERRRIAALAIAVPPAPHVRH